MIYSVRLRESKNGRRDCKTNLCRGEGCQATDLHTITVVELSRADLTPHQIAWTVSGINTKDRATDLYQAIWHRFLSPPQIANGRSDFHWRKHCGLYPGR